MADRFVLSEFYAAPIRSSLAEFAAFGLHVVRPCQFGFPAKILTPVDDILVPLIAERALGDLHARAGIAGVIATPELAPFVPDEIGLAICDDPMTVHHAIHAALAKLPGRLWSDVPSEIDPSAHVHPAAWVAPRNVRIGPGAAILAGAIVHERTVIGAETRVHSNAVVGADAYEIIMIDGRQQLRPQTGGVALGEACEIMAGTIVTRSAFCGATMIDSGSVLDGNVVISHDCRIGRDVRIGGSSWIGGRVTIGDLASLGPNCTIGNGLTVGDRAKVSLGAVVTRDVESEAQVSGNFAIDHAKMIEHMRRVR